MENNLTVKLVDPKSNETTAALGISEQRADEIMRVVKKAFVTTDKHTDVLEIASKEAKNANELAFACFNYGRITEKMHGGIDGMLKGLLDTLGKKGGFNPDEQD